MTRTIDLNCDLGEDPAALDRDEQLAGIVTSLNIACGGHAGDERTMAHFAQLAASLGRSPGAHPSYPDRPNFGRAEMAIAPEALESSLRDQLAALTRAAAGVRITHVKPHGALYHAAAHRRDIAEILARAVRDTCPHAAIVGPAGSPALDWWQGLDLAVIPEAFADRRYLPNGRLAPRTDPDAVLPAAEAAQQALDIATGRGPLTRDGTRLPLHAATLCIHSDTPDAITVAHTVRDKLHAAGIAIAPP